MIHKSDFPEIKWVVNGTFGEFPSFYSDNACRIISDKYFKAGESSWWEVVRRVAVTIAQSGEDQGYFSDHGETVVFARQLADGMLHQRFAFNSPVYFNVGIEDKPQCSACFIQGVEDNMESILDLARKEGMLFKHGSGTGTNLSKIRPKGSSLSKGGHASGPVDFMRMYDAGAGVIKSGGVHRRAAKMVILAAEHPDAEEFIWCKAKEEKRIKADVASGASYEDALARAQFQNGNNSVRVTNHFMHLALEEPYSYEAYLLEQMAKAAWECGDPGIQFDTTININMPRGLHSRATNPCSEFVFIDDSACNLASINLLKCDPYSDQFKADVRLLITAMDIIVEMSSYPSENIERNSHKYRPLGLGYTNLGAYLMGRGIAYGDDEAFDVTANVTERMSLIALGMSEELGAKFGNYPGGECRNAQLTLLAPTGTISFAMDCESTGIEPVFAEEYQKQLVGGGTVVAVPKCVENADPHVVKVALSSDPEKVVTPEEHLRMMAAAQPYLSGAISKTINMPHDCTWEDIRDIYVRAWELGLKCVAVFRDGCKAHQPMTTGKANPLPEIDGDLGIFKEYRRARLPVTRDSVTHKFSIGGTEGYLTVGLYKDGSPGELFINVSKAGSAVRGWADCWSILFSMALQYGIPLEKLVTKFRGSRFEPEGFTGGEDIKSATSIVDYAVQWLDQKFPGVENAHNASWDTAAGLANVLQGDDASGDYLRSGRPCPDCGTTMRRTGTCETCPACGWNGGCS
jgi:ribonucleoside-diphosphate reductase alpha chain